MKRCLPFLMMLISPPLASALEKEGGGVNLLASFIQMLAALALVVGLIFLIQALARRWVRMRGVGGEVRHIRVVETRYLAPRKSLLLVEVGGEYLLLSDGNEGVRLIKQVEVREDVEVTPIVQGGTVHPPGARDHGGRVAGICSLDLLHALVQRTGETIMAGWLLLAGLAGKLPVDFFRGLPSRIRLICRVGWIILKALAARLPLDFLRGIQTRIRSAVLP